MNLILPLTCFMMTNPINSDNNHLEGMERPILYRVLKECAFSVLIYNLIYNYCEKYTKVSSSYYYSHYSNFVINSSNYISEHSMVIYSFVNCCFLKHVINTGRLLLVFSPLNFVFDFQYHIHHRAELQMRLQNSLLFY